MGGAPVPSLVSLCVHAISCELVQLQRQEAAAAAAAACAPPAPPPVVAHAGLSGALPTLNAVIAPAASPTTAPAHTLAVPSVGSAHGGVGAPHGQAAAVGHGLQPCDATPSAAQQRDWWLVVLEAVLPPELLLRLLGQLARCCLLTPEALRCAGPDLSAHARGTQVRCARPVCSCTHAVWPCAWRARVLGVALACAGAGVGAGVALACAGAGCSPGMCGSGCGCGCSPGMRGCWPLQCRQADVDVYGKEWVCVRVDGVARRMPCAGAGPCNAGKQMWMCMGKSGCV